MKRKGVIGIVVENQEKYGKKVNDLIHGYGHIINGRMGINQKEENHAMISIIVEGDTDIIGEFTGRMGQIPEVSVSSTMLKKR